MLLLERFLVVHCPIVLCESLVQCLRAFEDYRKLEEQLQEFFLLVDRGILQDGASKFFRYNSDGLSLMPDRGTRHRLDATNLCCCGRDVFDGPHEVASLQPNVERGRAEHDHVAKQLVIDRDQGRSPYHKSGTGVMESSRIGSFWLPRPVKLRSDHCR